MPSRQPQHNGPANAALDDLGERLRQLFAHLVEEPPPPELVALLAALDAGHPDT